MRKSRKGFIPGDKQVWDGLCKPVLCGSPLSCTEPCFPGMLVVMLVRSASPQQMSWKNNILLLPGGFGAFENL